MTDKSYTAYTVSTFLQLAPSALLEIKLLELLLAFEIRGTTEDILYLAYAVKYEFFSHLLYLNSFCHVPL